MSNLKDPPNSVERKKSSLQTIVLSAPALDSEDKGLWICLGTEQIRSQNIHTITVPISKID